MMKMQKELLIQNYYLLVKSQKIMIFVAIKKNNKYLYFLFENI